MKRTILAACILLSGCYVDPNTGVVYSVPQYPQGTQFHQTLVYHYEVPPPNPYYRGAAPEAPPPPSAPAYDPPMQSYNDCNRRDAERYGYQQPEDCGVYVR